MSLYCKVNQSEPPQPKGRGLVLDQAAKANFGFKYAHQELDPFILGGRLQSLMRTSQDKQSPTIPSHQSFSYSPELRNLGWVMIAPCPPLRHCEPNILDEAIHLLTSPHMNPSGDGQGDGLPRRRLRASSQ